MLEAFWACSYTLLLNEEVQIVLFWGEYNFFVLNFRYRCSYIIVASAVHLRGRARRVASAWV
ncbi:MAG: hypothetical protein KAI82_03105, partial [Tritonibacter mobilis]|nr:hypothetical protein [Tritonibacter mobilis]